jgi:aldehyde dehydrogenase (NAD+)
LGNRVVVVPSTVLPTIATPFYKTIEASDVPGGVINLITGDPMNLGATLASHADVDAVWFHQMDRRGCAEIEKLSAPTLKRTWVDGGRGRDWWCDGQTAATDLLRHASQIKNVWVPYGV